MTALALLITAVGLVQESADLSDLLERKDYFSLRDAIGKASSSDNAFYRGVVANKFNRLDESAKQLSRYLGQAQTNPKFVDEARNLLCESHLKAFDYGKAADAYRALLPTIKDAEERKDTENSIRLWSALKDVPRQTVKFEGDTDLPMKESIGLQIPIEVGTETSSFIFDTGANISTISVSHARKLGMKIIEAEIEVGGISGTTVRSRLGHLKEMRIGKAVVRDSVFLVMEDKDLNIQGIQLNPILGYPVISALREVTLTTNGRLIVPAVSRIEGPQNLAMEGLTPLMQVTYRGRKITVVLDTGADTTVLYPPLYREWRTDIEQTGERASEWITGVGTRRQIASYRLKDFTLELAGKPATLAKVPVLTERTSEKSLHFYGNLGQDFFRKFPSMTLNFERMSVTFN